MVNARGDIMIGTGLSSGVNGTAAVNTGNYPVKNAAAGGERPHGKMAGRLRNTVVDQMMTFDERAVQRVLGRQQLSETEPGDYDTCIELSRRCAAERHIRAAAEHARRATSIDPSRPEAFNLLGAYSEVRGEPLEAQKYYRAALGLDRHRVLQPQVQRHQLPDVRFVFDDEDVRAGRGTHLQGLDEMYCRTRPVHAVPYFLHTCVH